jgi:hypothetical protein
LYFLLVLFPLFFNNTNPASSQRKSAADPLDSLVAARAAIDGAQAIGGGSNGHEIAAVSFGLVLDREDRDALEPAIEGPPLHPCALGQA